MKKTLFRLARTRLGASLFSFIVGNMTFLIPSEKLIETNALVAFHHPAPSYRVHILIVPRRHYGSLMELDAADTMFMQDLIRCVQDLVRELDLEAGGYRLLTNGGDLQDVPFLHFHLISKDGLPSEDALEDE